MATKANNSRRSTPARTSRRKEWKEKETRSSAELISISLASHVAEIAAECSASAIFVYTDAVGGVPFELPRSVNAKVFYVTRTEEEADQQGELGHNIIQVPNVKLSRMGQVKIAVLLALSRGHLSQGDIIICLSGVANSGTLDTIVVMEAGREFEMFIAPKEGEEMAPHVLPEVLERVIDIAAELGSEGREGKPVGALFVVGDTDRVQDLSRQMVLNPFKHYPEEERSVLSPALEETIKEYASLDGAFIIRGDGVLESAGTYLQAGVNPDFELPHGLGARHAAAAAITAVSNAVAITVSESTGTVTIFRKGHIITEIEKLRSSRALGARSPF